MNHIPIMLRETIRFLNIKKNGIYIDCTFGAGGHTKEILKKLNNKGILIVIDKDKASYDIAKKIKDNRIIAFNDNFSNLYEIVKKLKIINKIDGIIIDLGLSSMQIDNPKRGFSFQNIGPLDMRINQKQKLTAKDWLQNTSEKNISKTLYNYSNEKNSKQIAKEIKKKIEQINTTYDLAKIIKSKVYYCRKNPSTRTFLAIRMKINDEINELKKIMYISSQILKTEGILCILSFNSTERMIINNFLNSFKNKKKDKKILQLKIQLKPTESEIQSNVRSRSSILSVFIKR